MDQFNSFVMKFTACDSIMLGITMYVMHRWIPGPAYVASMIPMPGFEKTITVGESVLTALVANILSQKLAEKACMQ